jgi:hypothetical protein
MKKEPKDLIQYHYKAMSAFFDFLKTEDEETLMSDLYSIERHYKSWNGIQKTNKNLWFRFFKDDTAATTIADIKRDLNSPNKKYIMECMQISYDTAEIEVYFS